MSAPSWVTLVPGTRYRVAFDDCCARGHFEDVFVAAEPDEDGDANTLLFEHARLEQSWGPYEFTELTQQKRTP